MKTINGEIYYDTKEVSALLDEEILRQAEILKQNLREKKTINNSVRRVEYV